MRRCFQTSGDSNGWGWMMGEHYHICDRGKVYVVDLEQLQRAIWSGEFSAKAVVFRVPDDTVDFMLARLALEVKAEQILDKTARGLWTDGDVLGRGAQRLGL